MRMSSLRINGELVTLEEWSDQARVSIGRVAIYGYRAIDAMAGVVELLTPDVAA